MAKQITIKIKLMGTFLFCTNVNDQWKGMDTVSNNVGKKLNSFLVYLLLNHKRRISYEELIRQFWDNDGKDPGNALRNTLHKTRKLLRAMFPECEELLLTQDGCLVWNKEVRLELDVEELERLYKCFKEPDKNNDYIKDGLMACEIYKGEIFRGSNLEWQERINIYYLNIFVDLCTSLAELLSEQCRWGECSYLCQRALQFEPESETVTNSFMYALIMDGKPELAIRQYEIYRKMLWDEFEMLPSERIEKLYALASKRDNVEEYEKELIEQITCVDGLRQSFSCSLQIFRNLVNLEMRSMRRSGHRSSLVIIHLGNMKVRDDQRLERVLLQGLRAGDSFTKLSTDRFVLLLPEATEENAKKVMDRIFQTYGKCYPRSNVTVRFNVYPIIVREEGTQ